jgi:hypothetical protein
MLFHPFAAAAPAAEIRQGKGHTWHMMKSFSSVTSPRKNAENIIGCAFSHGSDACLSSAPYFITSPLFLIPLDQICFACHSIIFAGLAVFSATYRDLCGYL